MAFLVAGTIDDKVVERIEDFINDEMKGRKRVCQVNCV